MSRDKSLLHYAKRTEENLFCPNQVFTRYQNLLSRFKFKLINLTSHFVILLLVDVILQIAAPESNLLHQQHQEQFPLPLFHHRVSHVVSTLAAHTNQTTQIIHQH